MTVTFEEALKAQQLVEDTLLEDPNVSSVGIVEEINPMGEKTGSYAVKVGMISAEAYQNSVNHGSQIPKECLINTKEGEKRVHIQLERTGHIKSLSTTENKKAQNRLPSAVDDIGASSELVDTARRLRPCPGGMSIGHHSVTAGTLGLLLQHLEGPDAGKAYILSNNHVLADNNSAFIGDAIVQPGRHDFGIVGTDTIAHLTRWVPLLNKEANYVDAALAEVIGGKEWRKNVSSSVYKIGIPGSIQEAQLGMNVEKVGRTTGYTQGEIVSINLSLKVDFGKHGRYLFKEQMATTHMSSSGDSGSCLFEKGTKRPVGLLFAGSDMATYHNPMQKVLTSLALQHTNHAFAGKKAITFNATPPFHIITRPYSVGIHCKNQGSIFKNKSLLTLPSKNRMSKVVLHPVRPQANFTQSVKSPRVNGFSPSLFKPRLPNRPPHQTQTRSFSKIRLGKMK